MDATLLKSKSTRWIEVTVGVVTILAAVIVWQALQVHERRHVQKMVSAAARGIQADLTADMQSHLHDEASLAQHVEFAGAGKSDWTALANRYLETNPWCPAIMWLDSQGRMEWLVPATAKPEVLRQVVEQHGRQALAEGSATGQPSITHSFQLPSGETVNLVVVPGFRAGEQVGSVVAVTDMRKSLAAILEDHAHLGYDAAIFDNGTELYRFSADARDEPAWAQTVEAQLPGVVWRVKVWPRPEVLAEQQSVVPEILFAVVSALGFALILAFHSGVVARGKSRSADRLNAQLTKEIGERQRIEAALRASQARLAGVLETSADAIISTDERLRITYFNQTAEQIFGYMVTEAVGQPLDILLPARVREVHRQHMARFAAGPPATMLMGERASIVGLRKDGSEFPAEAAISKMELNGETILTAFLRDATARVAAEEALRKAHEELEDRVDERTDELAVANALLHRLSGHLLQSQEEERRRIARELHDTTAGDLVLIAMALDKMRDSPGVAPKFGEQIQDCWHKVQQALEDIRTLSYRLHPPMLEGLGLGSALRWYINGFSERSGIDILLKFDASTPRLPRDMELTLFRIVQESLTNVQRHSQSDAAEISLTCQNAQVRLEIADHGVGMRSELLADDSAMLGVGIAGMRERVRQLGGQLDVQSGAAGTTITATLPLEQSLGQGS